jgi:hypothetical protein
MYNQKTAKLFRQNAAELLGWAERADFPEQKRWLTIAAMYHVLARHLENDEPATSWTNLQWLSR